MTHEISFFCPGRPQTAGSKTIVPTKAGPRVVDGGTRQVRDAKKSWRGDLRDAVVQATRGKGLVFPIFPDEPVWLQIVIVRKRPGAHLGTGRNAGVVKEKCVGLMPVERPDTVKLVRAAEDALTGVLWGDDSQIVHHSLYKVFADRTGLPATAEGLYVCVSPYVHYVGPRLQFRIAA